MLNKSYIIDGITCYDAVKNEEFTLRAQVLFWCGDIPAITKLMCITGHNSYMGCRFCDLRGVTSNEPGKNHVYYPLKPPTHHKLPIYNPSALPMRTHHMYYQRAEEYIKTKSKTARKNLSTNTGKFIITYLSII